MATNRVTAIDTRFEAPVPTGTKSGDPVLVFTHIPAVAQTDEGAGVGNVAGRASVDTEGIHAFEVEDAVAAEGTALYLDSGTLTTTGTGDPFGWSIHMPSPVGRAGGTKAAGAGTVNVRLRKA